MKDKFRTNFFIVLPAAILTFVLLLILPSHSEVVSVYAKDANLLLIAPYLFVLVSALCGMNVFAVLILGTVFSLAAGIFTGIFPAWRFLHVWAMALTPCMILQ